MLVLAFDTSTSVATVAVARVSGADRGGDVQEEREILAETSVAGRGSGGSSEALLPAIHSTLGLCGIGVGEIGRILVGLGPGTFTGIRISAATARSLAFGGGLEVAGGDTLSALAEPALSVLGEGGSVLSVVDARRGEVFARRHGGGGAGEVICAEPESLPEEMSAALVTGDGAVRYRERLGHLGFIPPDGSPLHRVTAAGMVRGGDLTPVTPDELVPIYVRQPDAEARRERNPWSEG
ncbi:tRNA (adenosine(37)-N6)-threonylcarbamoyltransferase complex dimerization subunit type 1 TsaB [Rubrobacter aplysinae]|uniref:tRNA (adenosine(37)-N6)-threonylcarbamoyltransferase complex dimerization subunit type 1 TsaB n=1 Tax=Rubrobacter aplysinae TaxID=909625 RepID=UPI00069E7F8F|nr:tRNA (adenosine(37)-N6)-threonylcarbamoyltransferase complex dimerization subunit type 1 TsaB [Rubrobacter aplysinae]